VHFSLGYFGQFGRQFDEVVSENEKENWEFPNKNEENSETSIFSARHWA
jgi:hypothetical protein